MPDSQALEFGYPLGQRAHEGVVADQVRRGTVYSHGLNPEGLEEPVLEPLDGLDVVQTGSLVQKHRAREQTNLSVRQLVAVQGCGELKYGVDEVRLVHELELLPGDVGAVLEGHGRVGGHLGDVAQPDLEEADLYQDQLVVLGQLAEAGDALGELDDPLDRGRDARRELLPEPDPVRLDRFRRRGRRLWVFRTRGL